MYNRLVGLVTSLGNLGLTGFGGFDNYTGIFLEVKKDFLGG